MNYPGRLSTRNPLFWTFVLGPLLLVSGFLGYGFSSVLLMSTVLILSTLIFTFSKEEPGLAEKSANDEILRLDQENSADHLKYVAPEAHLPENVPKTAKKETQEDEGSRQVDDYSTGSSPVFLSESDCLGRSSTSEDSEVDWPFQDNASRSRDCSDDGSISDEDSLIEIALPSGHYLSHNKEEELKKFNLQKKMPGFATGPFLKQQQYGLVDLLAEFNEMNEEENLIEIDISVGSIKCPRFEIEA